MTRYEHITNYCSHCNYRSHCTLFVRIYTHREETSTSHMQKLVISRTHNAQNTTERGLSVIHHIHQRNSLLSPFYLRCDKTVSPRPHHTECSFSFLQQHLWCRIELVGKRKTASERKRRTQIREQKNEESNIPLLRCDSSSRVD